MRRTLVLLVSVLFASFLGVPAASAGSAHFVNNAFAMSQDGTTLTVSAKEAGLGDEPQIHVVLTADAACINPGDHHPKAANKESVSAAGDFPVQNGKADITIQVTATFQPDCTPPMTVVFTDIVLTDTTNNLVHRF
jgi:hypothetical protein